MLAAFKHDLQLHDDEELNDDMEIIDVTDEDNDSDEITEGEETAAEDALGLNQQDHTAYYEECETQHDVNLVSYQCVSCFIHTLQLVVHTHCT